MNDWALVLVGGMLIGYAAVSARLRSTVISSAMVYVAAGLLVGSHGLQLIELDSASTQVRMLATVTLTILLFTDAVRIDLTALRADYSVPARLLLAGLPLTIAAGALIGLTLFGQLSLWTAAALAAILAPTDAALGLAVVTNRRLPSRIRQGLNVESGLNDGICLPLLIVFLTLAQAGQEPGELEPLKLILEEIGFGVLGGTAAGALGAWTVRTFSPRGWMDPTWKQINSVVTALSAFALADHVLHGSGFIAAFVAGLLFGALSGERGKETTFFAEQGGELLNAVTFLLFGAVLLGPALGLLDWRVAVYGAISLTVVRMVPVALALLGTRMRWQTIGFLGWFGPRGLASIVFVLLLVEQTELSERPLILTVVTWTVFVSVYAHGLTALPGANRFADWYAAHRRDHAEMPESIPVHEHRVRAPVAGASLPPPPTEAGSGAT